MEVLGIVVIILGAIALGVLNIVEYVEYRRYQKAAHAVIAFGTSMQASFDQVAEQLNLYGGRMQSMSQGILLNDADIMTIKAIIQIHNEALKLKNSDQLFEINEKLKKVSGLDGEDTTPTI